MRSVLTRNAKLLFRFASIWQLNQADAFDLLKDLETHPIALLANHNRMVDLSVIAFYVAKCPF